jgi:hypothetical protein
MINEIPSLTAKPTSPRVFGPMTIAIADTNDSIFKEAVSFKGKSQS